MKDAKNKTFKIVPLDSFLFFLEINKIKDSLILWYFIIYISCRLAVHIRCF